jgi:hypothetical protein
MRKHIPFKKPGVSLRTLPQHDRQFYALDPTDIRLVSTKFCLAAVRATQVFTKSSTDTLRGVPEKSSTLPTEFSKRLSDNVKLLFCQVCCVFANFLCNLMLVEFCNINVTLKYRKFSNIQLSAWFNVLRRYTVVGSDLASEFVITRNGIGIWGCQYYYYYY